MAERRTRPKKERPTAEIAVVVDRAATPSRVAAAANIFDKLLREAAPDVPYENFSMVVENFTMRASLRSWTQPGADVVGDIVRTLRKPVESIRESTRCRAIARVFAAEAAPLQGEGTSLQPSRRSRRRIAIDETLVRALEGAAKESWTAHSASTRRGGTTFRSQVFRVGRSAETSRWAARIVFDGRTKDVPCHKDALDDLVRAMRDEVPVSLNVHASWTRRQDGSYSVDPNSVEILTVTKLKSMTGMEFMKHVPNVSLETSAEILDALRDSRGEYDD